MSISQQRGIANPQIHLIRVSSKDQGKSGLGLEAQRETVRRYAAITGGTPLAEYVEVESGKHNDESKRPVFVQAVKHARRTGATLVISKLDRLIRSTAVLEYLRKTQVKFVACDNPQANELVIDILVAVAKQEAKAIGIRTKDGLAIYKSHNMLPRRIRDLYPNGVPPEVAERHAGIAGKLGAQLPQCRPNNPAARAKGARNSAKARRAEAIEFFEDLAPIFIEKRQAGLTFQAIADWANAQGHKTRQNAQWGDVQVRRVINRGL